MTPVTSVEAVIAGDPQQLKQALADDPAGGSARDRDGVSVMMLALYRRRYDLAEIILAREPPLDAFELAALGHPDELATLLATDPPAVTARSADGRRCTPPAIGGMCHLSSGSWTTGPGRM
jgi:hypothetical protein